MGRGGSGGFVRLAPWPRAAAPAPRGVLASCAGAFPLAALSAAVVLSMVALVLALVRTPAAPRSPVEPYRRRGPVP